MNAYMSFFKIRFIHGLQYRAAALAGITTQLAWGFIYLMLFQAFYETGADNSAMTYKELVSYIWMQQAFLALFMSWFLDNELFDMISKGNVSYELCRPLDLYNLWFIKNCALRLSKAVLRCFPILIIAFFLPEPYTLTLPPSSLSLFLFLLSMIISLFVVVAYGMFVYIFTFYTISPMGVRIALVMTADFFSGGIIPLPLFPDWLANYLYMTPFAAMQNVPFRIYSGNLQINEALVSIGLQIFWAMTLITIGKWFLSRAIKRVVVQGG